MKPGMQSPPARQSTHDICPLHFCPEGQSLFEAHTTQFPDEQTCPVMLAAHPLLVVHGPAVMSGGGGAVCEEEHPAITIAPTTPSQEVRFIGITPFI